MKARVGLAVVAALVAVGCKPRGHGSAEEPKATSAIDPADRPAECPASAPAPALLPSVTTAHRSAAYWIERAAQQHDVDAPVLTPSQVRALNQAMEVPRAGFSAQRDLLAPVDLAELAAQVRGRFEWLEERFAAGELVTEDGPLAASQAEPLELHAELRVALATVQLYCAPTPQAYYSPSGGPVRTDRNRCSAAGPQEVVQVLAPWPGGMALARTRYSWGWIAADAPLSPPLEPIHARAFVRGPHAVVVEDQWSALPRSTRIALADDRGREAFVASADGVARVAVADGAAMPVQRPLTRRAFLEAAFGYLGAPYGFGGIGGGIDCSRLLLDVFEEFDLHLPRHSSWQVEGASFWVDVTAAGESDKLRLLDAAAAKGIVLLQLPGHIMLYLGRDAAERPMVLHALAEYQEVCPETALEIQRLVNTVQVSDLELGRGSSKRSLLERIERIGVIGEPPGIELAGIAHERPAAPVSQPLRRSCEASDRLLVTPAAPLRGASVRVVGTSSEDPGPVELAVFDPDGQRVATDLVTAGGPPHGLIAQLKATRAGTWTAVLGDGERVAACRRFRVTAKPAPSSAAADAVWSVRRAWNPAMEDLYAVFVERLFDYPLDDDRTWPTLQALIDDPEHNILHGHLSLDEDAALNLEPDCADLPYTLRAYFAWKLGLPFGFRQCSRARPGRPPRCHAGADNLMTRAELGRSSEVQAFQAFAHRELRNGVHSSSGRTAPADDDSDFYPVPLTREALVPGTLFVDPFGHLIVLVDWIPQTSSDYGVLIGADAQPDGTVGRRRFWRGSFLFDPDASSGGAGFKAFRPWRYEDASKRLEAPDNDALRRDGSAPFSLEQYSGSAADFYDSMQALINPRPLDPRVMQRSLIDALEEQVARRGNSIETGEAFMRSRRFAPIDMPAGADIFLTTGPWEDFSTPSRDWRLLIAIDTVLDFPAAVERAPAQYGVDVDAAPAVAEALRRELDVELAKRRFEYQRSDGSQWQLSLKDVVTRREALEMAYNPNDCVEVRWGAPQDSDERASCKRSAPNAQRQRMQQHRKWFSERRRPAN